MRGQGLARAIGVAGVLGAAASCAVGASEPAGASAESVASAGQAAVTCVTIQRTGTVTPGGVEDAPIVFDPTDPIKASTNYGLTAQMNTGYVGTEYRRALMKFDLSGIPAGSPIASATLTYRMIQSPGKASLELHAVTAPWSEGSVTWNGIGTGFDPAIEATVATLGVTNNTAQSVDVTSLVSRWMGGLANNGILFDHPAAGRTTVGASEAPTVSPRPKLYVCYTAPTCSDGVQNGGEAGVDCGGSCAACDPCAGVVCQAPDSCHAAGACSPLTGTCSFTTLANGTACTTPACSPQLGCQAACAAGVCVADACHDGVRNGSETDVDCGGSSCGDCSLGDACAVDADCTSDICSLGTCRSSETTADLSALAPGFGTLSPAFDPSVPSYAVSLGFFAAGIRITPTTLEPGETVRVAGVPVASGQPSQVVALPVGVSTIPVLVTSGDGLSSRTYDIQVTRQPLSSMGESAFLKSSVPEANAMVGTSTYLQENTLIVSARYENSGVTNSGGVYVFDRGANRQWTQTAHLKASNPGADDVFGHTVRLSGNTLAIGVKFEDSDEFGDGYANDNNSKIDSGALYVFDRNPATGTWAQTSFIKAFNATEYAEFGYAVDISGDTIAVGSRFEDSSAAGVPGGAVDSGAVYVYRRNASGHYDLQQYLKASNAVAGDEFGYAVAISGDTIAVGARLRDDRGLESGAAYIFTRDAVGHWAQQQVLFAANAGPSDRFGVSTALDGDTLIVGSRLEDGDGASDGLAHNNNNAPQSGVAYAFVRGANGVWTQQGYLKAPDAVAFDGCGDSVWLSANTAVVGCVNKGGTVVSSGLVEVYTRDGAGVWSHAAALQAHNPDTDDEFGHSVGIWGDTLAIGARYESSPNTAQLGYSNSLTHTGAEYVFDSLRCGDGVRDGVETGVDCGGACGDCSGGEACYVPENCSSSVCTSNVCQ